MLRKFASKNWASKSLGLGAVAILYWMTPCAMAQASSYVPPVVLSSTGTVGASGLPGNIGDVALDACGNIYAVSQASGEVVEIPSTGGAATALIGSTITYDSASLWIDATKENLYVIEGDKGSVWQIPITNCAANPSAQTNIGIGNLGAISYYWAGSAVSTDAAENLFIATNVACCASANELLEQYASKTYTTGTTLLSSLANPITSIAVDSTSNIYYVSGGGLYELQVATAATSSSPATYNASAASYGGSYNNVVGVAIDSTGNLYVADGGASTLFEIPYETTASGSALNPSDEFIVATGVSIGSTPVVGPATGKPGVIYFANLGSVVYQLTQFTASAGQITAGSSGTIAVDAVFNSATTPGALSIFPSGGFFAQTGGTCAANQAYAAGSSCTATLTFSPTVPGISNGGATLQASTGTTPLATIYLSGEGMGAEITMDPGTVASTGSGFKTPEAVAIDAAGDTFYADAGNNAVLEFTPGSSTPISIGAGLKTPAGVAVDGAGNVFIADTGNNRIVEVPMVSGALSNAAQVTLVAAADSKGNPTPIASAVLNSPAGVAVDNMGDLFIADTGNNRIVGIPYNGTLNTSAAIALGSSLNGPLAVAPDNQGNLYVADSGEGRIYEIIAALVQPTQQLIAVGFGNPTGLALDASGSLFVADYANGDLLRIPYISGSLEGDYEVEAGIGISTPYGVALDPYGNLYVSSGSGGSANLVTRTSTTVDFGDWAQGSTSGTLPVEVENAGNQTLTLGSSSYYTATGDTGDFTISGSCAAGGTVAAGTSCELDPTFTPQAIGSYTDTLALVSNALNPSAAQVTLTGNGASTAATVITLAITSPANGAPVYGQQITLTATVKASSGSTTPSGTVTLVVDGIAIADATLSSSGVATFNLASGLTGGNHTLVAVYNGTASFNGSVSSTLKLNVPQASTQTTLAVASPYVNPYSSLSGGTVTLTATVGIVGVGVPSGTVTFTAAYTSPTTGKTTNETLGTAPLQAVATGGFQATFSTTTLAVGNYEVVATYSGDPNYLGSVSPASSTIYILSTPYVATTASGTTLTSSANTNGTITLTVTSYGGWTGVVGFACDPLTLPPNARCVFSPGQVEVVGSTASSAASTPPVVMSVTIDQPPQTPTASKLLWWLAAPTGLLLLFARRRTTRRGWPAAVLVAGLMLLGSSAVGLTSCASGEAAYVTPAGTATVTVIASSDAIVPASNPPTSQPCPAGATSAPCAQQTFQFTLTVQ